MDSTSHDGVPGSSTPGHRDAGGHDDRVTVLRFPADGVTGRGYPDRVRFGVLGTLTVVDDDGGQRRLSGPARRRLLGALVARAGRVVPLDTLIEDLWADAPPATAERTLQSHVVRLRDDLGRDDDGSPIITEPHGYRLNVSPTAVDAWCFERDLGAGRQALADGDAAGAVALLDQALSWWRGTAYAEFPDALFAVSERLRLQELRALAAEARTDAGLALGASGELVGELEQRLMEEPYRERSWEQLVLALYRSGRQVDALSAYRRARERLVDDLGLEPSPALRDLERRILDHDPALDAPVAVQHVATVHALGTPAGPAPVLGSVAPQPVAAAAGAAPGLVVAAAIAPECPYRGLRPYSDDDSAYFVGRERLTAELAGRLVDNDLLVVVGPSGAGKSSLLSAGLVPALRGGAIPGSAAWRIRTVVPGSGGAGLLDAEPCDLLVVDQAEELFTLGGDGADASESIRRAGSLLSARLASGTRLVLAVRGDFYGRLAELSLLTGRIGNATVLVGPLSEEATRRVVVEPAARQGVSVAPDLVDEIVADVSGRSGTLPLLSAALEQTWAHRTGDQLTLDAYRSGGGVRGALESLAESTFESMDPPARAAARRLLLRLVTMSGGTWARRPLPLRDIAPEADAASREALESLARARLVLVNDQTVELTHEALIFGWPRLRGWLDERAVMADQLEHLDASSLAWDRAGRPPEDVVRGPRLQAALDWRGEHPDDLAPLVDDYLDASREAVDAELARERARRRRLTTAVVATGLACVLLAVAGVVAVRQRSEADAASLSSDARLLATGSYQAPDGTLRGLLAVAAFRLQDSLDTRGALMSSVLDDGGAVYRVPTEDRLMWVGATSDGSVLVVDNHRRLSRFSPTTRTLAPSVAIPGYWPTDLSVDGRYVVTCGDWPQTGQAGEGPISVVSTVDGTVAHVLPTRSTDDYSSRCGRFTLDGRWFVVADTPGAQGSPESLAIYDAHDWSAAPRRLPMPARIGDIATGRDRFAVRLVDGAIEVRDAGSLAVVARATRPDARCDEAQCFLVITPDGRRLAFSSASAPQAPAQLSVSELAGPAALADGLPSLISGMAFSFDGSMLASTSYGGSLLVQTTATKGSDAKTVNRAVGRGPGSVAAWSGSGAATALLSVGDRELTSWNLSTLPRTVTLGAVWPADTGDPVRVGSHLAGVHGFDVGKSSVYSTDLVTGVTRSQPLPIAGDHVARVSPSADGSRVAVTCDLEQGRWRYLVLDMDTGATLLDRDDLSPPGTLRADADTAAWGAVISPDGSRIAITSGPRELTLLDVGGTGPIRPIRLTGLDAGDPSQYAVPWYLPDSGALLVQLFARPPDEGGPTPAQRVAYVDRDGSVRSATLDPSEVEQVEVSPDRDRVVVASRSGVLRVLGGADLRAVAARSRTQSGRTRSVSWSPDGATVLVGGSDGRLRFWDSATLRPLGESVALGGFGYDGVMAWFRPDGLVGGVVNETLLQGEVPRTFTFPATTQAWLAEACGFAARDLTDAEWELYLPGRPRIAVCPS